MKRAFFINILPFCRLDFQLKDLDFDKFLYFMNGSKFEPFYLFNYLFELQKNSLFLNQVIEFFGEEI
jgi:hypothetical protein